MLTAGGGYIGRDQRSIFPDSWLPHAIPKYLVKWLNSVAQARGTRVYVDIHGRPLQVTIKRSKGFIDVSREARCRRSLLLLRSQLDTLADVAPSVQEQQRRSLALSRLDQGLGDLIRVVRYAQVAPRGEPRSASSGRSRVDRAAAATSSRTRSRKEKV